MTKHQLQREPRQPRRKADLRGLSERELLEKLFEMTCPSCDKEQVRKAAEHVYDEYLY